MSSNFLFGSETGGAKLKIRKSARARNYRLKVDWKTGDVLLTMPHHGSERRALSWAMEHRDWVERELKKLPPELPIVNGALIPFMGDEHRIEWCAESPRTVTRRDGKIIVGGPSHMAEARLMRWLKHEALLLLTEETHEFADRVGRKVARVHVADTVSRWGSCSSSGSIRYNWRLILAPSFVRRATVAHETAHLVHLNHKAEFHALVEYIFGEDPSPARLWLRQNGPALLRIGRRR